MHACMASSLVRSFISVRRALVFLFVVGEIIIAVDFVHRVSRGPPKLFFLVTLPFKITTLR